MKSKYKYEEKQCIHNTTINLILKGDVAVHLTSDHLVHITEMKGTFSQWKNLVQNG